MTGSKLLPLSSGLALRTTAKVRSDTSIEQNFGEARIPKKTFFGAYAIFLMQLILSGLSDIWDFAGNYLPVHVLEDSPHDM